MSETGENRKLIIAVADDKYFVSHRLAVGKAAVEDGWDVTVVAGRNGAEREILDAGMKYIPIAPVAESSVLGFQLKALITLTRLLNRNPGAILHIVGMSMLPVGNLAAGLTRRYKGIVNAVSGLGSMFQRPDTLKARLMLKILRFVWQRENGSRKIKTIVQNHDDEKLLLDNKIITRDEIEYIKGSGVDLGRFHISHPGSVRTGGRYRIIFSGRLLRSKGVEDLVKAAEILRPEWGDKAEFLICGGVHHNPDSLTEDEIRRLCDGIYIVWAGHRKDMAEILASGRIMVFPSYYREGVPLALIEASAAGLPIITCDSVGCRDTIDGNGYLVNPKNPEELARRIDELLRDDEKCRAFGQRSRMIAERDYDLRKVVGRHLRIYQSVAEGGRNSGQESGQ